MSQNTIPCTNPAHGVKDHVVGSDAARECQAGSQAASTSRSFTAQPTSAAGTTVQSSTAEIDYAAVNSEALTPGEVAGEMKHGERFSYAGFTDADLQRLAADKEGLQELMDDTGTDNVVDAAYEGEMYSSPIMVDSVERKGDSWEVTGQSHGSPVTHTFGPSDRLVLTRQ